jgi:hypothetical protein
MLSESDETRGRLEKYTIDDKIFQISVIDLMEMNEI